MDEWNSYPIIDEYSDPDFTNLGMKGHDPSQYVPEMFDSPAAMPLIPTSEYDARIAEQDEQQSSLEHLYLRAGWENLDQNGDGFCWGYSVGHCQMMVREVQHQPRIRLNPHATCSIIKGGRDEGGWCGLSADFGRRIGYAVEGTGPGQWPLHSRNLRSDTPELRAEMAKHQIVEDWYDLARPVHGQVLTERQVDTCVLLNQPCAVDFNWWGHSVCYLRLVKIEAGSYGRLILNSWKGWGRRGLAVLRGSQARPDGAISVRVTTPSIN